jgi:CRISPR-associated endonuclease Csy4
MRLQVSNSNGYYTELQLKPNAELSANFILSKLYSKLHISFVQLQDKNGIVPVGVSFPEYEEKGLGKRIRIFSPDESNLHNMNLNQVLEHMQDYVNITDVRSVPKSAEYLVCKRQQVKSSNIRLARRRAKRHGISEQEALNYLDQYKEDRIKTPYIQVLSHSSKNLFRLFIQQQKVENQRYNGFNAYGLSINSTVPCF